MHAGGTGWCWRRRSSTACASSTALTAGMLGMSWWRFTATNLVAAILWAAAWIGATLLVEEHVGAILPFLRTAKPWLFLAALLAVVGWPCICAVAVSRRARPPVDRRGRSGHEQLALQGRMVGAARFELATPAV